MNNGYHLLREAISKPLTTLAHWLLGERLTERAQFKNFAGSSVESGEPR